MKAIRSGLSSGRPPEQEVVTTKSKISAEQRRSRKSREAKLREWRTQTSEAQGISTMAVLPNYALENLVKNPPVEGEDLGLRCGIGPRRAEKYGERLLALCHGSK